MKQLTTVLKIIRFLLLAIYLCLLIIHFIIKDHFQSVSFLYYASPLPLISIFGMLVTLLFLKRKKTLYFLSTVLLAISIYFFVHYFGSELKDQSAGISSHILFWNVAENDPLPTDILIDHIQQFEPEIITLVEALDVSNDDLKILKSACPDYHFYIMEGDMLVGTKGTVDDIVYEFDGDYYKLNYFTVNFEHKQLSVMIADVSAGPTLDRSIPLNKILEIANTNHLDIIVGDFNTPYESVFFNDFKSGFNSFHNYSIGLTSTWPIPIPMIEIDQVWIGKTFQPIRMEKFSYKLSDHKLLIAEYQ